MKSVNYLKAIGVGAACLGVLAGCSSTGQDWDYQGDTQVPLVQTEQYLPVQEQDENGLLLPYEAEPDPYAALKGRIDKESVTTYIDARRAFQAKKYDLADQLLSELTETEPKLSGPWVMRGDIATEQDQLDKAVEYYAKAVEVNDVNFNAWLRLAKAQRQRGHFTHAQNTYAKALDIWPDCPEAHLNLGVLYDLYLNQSLQAQAHMEAYALLSNNPNDKAAAWLEEIRNRTGVASALTIIGPDGEPVSADASATAKDQPAPVNQELATAQE